MASTNTALVARSNATCHYTDSSHQRLIIILLLNASSLSMQSISASCIHKKENHIQLQIQPLNLPPKIYPLTGTFTLARQI